MIEDIPSSEQLMGVLSEPHVDEFLKFALYGLIWPGESALLANAVPVEHLEETLWWVDSVLRPEWRAPDLPLRMRAATEIVSNQDALLARYATDGTKIQIVVTRSYVHFVIAPCTPEMLRTYLNTEFPGDDPVWTGVPWSLAAVADFTIGYHPAASLTSWRDSLYYLSNSRGVKFSFRKVEPRGRDILDTPKSVNIPSEESERHWFFRR